MAKLVKGDGGFDNSESFTDSERYSKNPAFTNAAFAYYCKGLSLPNVIAVLLPEWPEVSLRTLQRIAKENRWSEARAGMHALHTDAMKNAEGVLPECVAQLQRLCMQMEGRSGSLDHKEIAVYRKLVEDVMWYTGKHPKLKDSTPLAVSGDTDIAALLEAIAEDEVVAGAWKRRRAYIEKAFKEKLAAKEAAKRKIAKIAKGKK